MVDERTRQPEAKTDRKERSPGLVQPDIAILFTLPLPSCPLPDPTVARPILFVHELCVLNFATGSARPANQDGKPPVRDAEPLIIDRAIELSREWANQML